MNKTRKVKPMVCKSPGTLEFIGEKNQQERQKIPTNQKEKN